MSDMKNLTWDATGGNTEWRWLAAHKDGELIAIYKKGEDGIFYDDEGNSIEWIEANKKEVEESEL